MEAVNDHPRRSMDHGQHPTTATTTRRRKTDQGSINPVEATVTKLLVATKQLLEGLTHWASQRMSEEQVSDIFVNLATQFNLASQTFHDMGIDTSDLAHIPDDLRNCLETALGEDPSPASLDLYLPKVKEIIINLLQGLRQKQNVYREQFENKSARQPLQQPVPQKQPQKLQQELQQEQQKPSLPPIPLSPPPNVLPSVPPNPTLPKLPPQPSNGSPRFPQPQIHVQPSSTNGSHEAFEKITNPNGNRHSANITGSGYMNSYPSPRHQSVSVVPSSTSTLQGSSLKDDSSHEDTLASLRKTDAITRRASSRRHSQRFSTLLEQNTPPVPRRQYPVSDSNLMTTYPGHFGPVASSPLANPHFNAQHDGNIPNMLSPYNDQMYPKHPTLGTKSNLSAPPSVPMPLPPNASPYPPILPVPAAYPPMIEVQLEESNQVAEKPKMDDIVEEKISPAPTHTGASSTVLEASQSPAIDVPESVQEPTDMTLFLQVGKSVKKTKFEGELTHSGLRMLFMEKFQYNPGQDDFPTIYVKDPQTNIHYELESLSDVKQNAFLTLNVDDLENIQRKMDQGFASLAKELHDIKKAQENAEQARQKAAAAAAAAAVAANIQPERSSALTEGSPALRSMVQKAMIKHKANPSIDATEGQSKASVADLKSHYDEVQTLRRDLSVVRQLYTELQTETKSMLGSLAGYTNQMKKQAQETPMSSRMFIENGKVNLDNKSESLTNKIEELQDVVEDMKVNVTQRRGRPSESSLTFVDKQCLEIEKEIAELSDYIQTLRPSWKKTWEVELQTIVKEQMFLKEQEALLEDLKEDRSSLVQTLANLKKVLELQAKNGSGQKSREYFFQPVIDENFEGLKTVLEEVKMIEPDSDKRLKAMAQMEKLRHIELSNRIDEFEQELTDFVGSNKLKKTGGAMEIERQRQQRDSDNLKAMFAASTANKPVEQQTQDEELL